MITDFKFDNYKSKFISMDKRIQAFLTSCEIYISSFTHKSQGPVHFVWKKGSKSVQSSEFTVDKSKQKPSQ